MRSHELTPDQVAEAERIYLTLREAADRDLRDLAEFLATKTDRDTFGATEFEVRDRVHRIGRTAIESALAGRKRGATTAAPAPAPAAARPPGSNAGRPKPS